MSATVSRMRRSTAALDDALDQIGERQRDALEPRDGHTLLREERDDMGGAIESAGDLHLEPHPPIRIGALTAYGRRADRPLLRERPPARMVGIARPDAVALIPHLRGELIDRSGRQQAPVIEHGDAVA